MESPLDKLPQGHFFGETKRAYRSGGVSLFESVFPRAANIPRHDHACAFFYWIAEGTCVDRHAGHQFIGGRSALVFHPAGTKHANFWPDGGRCFHIEIADQAMNAVCRRSAVFERSLCFTGSQNPVVSRMYEEFENPDTFSPLILEALVTELLVHSARLPADRRLNPPPWLRRVREMLCDQFAENLPLVAIAATAGVHPSHLCRGFRRHFGVSLGEFVRQLRIEHACRQLRHTDIPLTDLALQAGFSDQSHFSRTFKVRVGMTPAAYRRINSPRKF